MKTIVFSKNRACQLDLLLRSLNIPVTVLYTHDELYRSGYDELIRMHQNVEFVKETDFKGQVISLLDDDYIMFLCDDDVMLEPFDINCKEFRELRTNEQILCLSLRLDSHVEHTPELDGNKWAWKGCHRSWGYPMSVTSTIFRKTDIVPLLTTGEFNHPVLLEVMLRQRPPNRPLMICCDRWKFVNVLANRTEPHFNRYRTTHQSLEFLNELFLSGKRISLERIRRRAPRFTYCFILASFEFEDRIPV